MLRKQVLKRWNGSFDVLITGIGDKKLKDWSVKESALIWRVWWRRRMARWHDNSLSRRSYRARSLLHGRWSEWFCTPCLSGYFQFGDNTVSCGVILNSFYINFQGFFHKAANQTLVQSYVQEERTYVRSRDYPNFSDMHGYPNKPISMYCNSHLVPMLGKIKQKKSIIRCCALRRFFFVLFPQRSLPSMGARVPP